MPRLFTYCIPFDDGAAPNPYWGQLTLAICKPLIRRTAKRFDWVVGTGSTSRKSGGFAGRVVYAMEVSDVKTMAEYDKWTRDTLPQKIPDVSNKDPRRRVGDSIYDYSFSPPKQREGVHVEANRKTDLAGEHVLLSTNFYYFGSQPAQLPESLRPIVHQTQGHKVKANEPYVIPFLDWLKGLRLTKNSLLGEPYMLRDVATYLAEGAGIRCQCAEEDEKIIVS